MGSRTGISFSLLAIALLSALEVSLSSFINCSTSVGYGYYGANGPDNWGMLDPNWVKCSAGKMQSPINIPKINALYIKKLGYLTGDYNLARATLVNSISYIGVTYEEMLEQLVIDGKNYTLKQMHWHTPSEHRIHGFQYAAELHLVHEAEDGSNAVVAILYRYGIDDPFISSIKDKLDQLTKENCGSDEIAQIPLGKLDVKQIEWNTRTYYRYDGSLTTPPCTESVTWIILGKVRSISWKQVEALKAPLDSAYKNNARPLQALNWRRIEYSFELGI